MVIGAVFHSSAFPSVGGLLLPLLPLLLLLLLLQNNCCSLPGPAAGTTDQLHRLCFQEPFQLDVQGFELHKFPTNMAYSEFFLEEPMLVAALRNF